MPLEILGKFANSCELVTSDSGSKIKMRRQVELTRIHKILATTLFASGTGRRRKGTFKKTKAKGPGNMKRDPKYP